MRFGSSATLANPRLVVLRMLAGGKTPDVGSRTYTQIMREQMLKGEESEVSETWTMRPVDVVH